MKLKIRLLYFIILLCLITACVIGIGYTPPFIPVRVSATTEGEVNIGLVASVSTPIGVFDLEGDITIFNMRQKYQKRLFILRVDKKIAVAELDSKQSFKAEYSDENTLFRKVAIENSTDGDIILELESVSGTATPVIKFVSLSDIAPISYYPCPGANPSNIQVGNIVYVCTQSDHLIVHESADYDSITVRRMSPGEKMVVIGGPVCGNNEIWWQLRLENGWKGWAVEGGDNIDPHYICLSY
jgi:hypothetical protein